MKVDLDSYSSVELRELREQIDAALRQRRRDDERQARKELKAVAARYGFNLDDLVGGGTKKPKTAVRFRHPERPDLTWSGRGRKPRWIKEWEEQGRPTRDLAVG